MVLQLEAHALHVVGNFLVGHMATADEGLLTDNLELTLAVAPEAEYDKAGLREVGIVQGDTVEGEDGLDEVVEADALDKRGTMVVNPGLATLGNLFAEGTLKRVVNTLHPAANGLGPFFYNCLLLRSALALSLEVAESLCSI